MNEMGDRLKNGNHNIGGKVQHGSPLGRIGMLLLQKHVFLKYYDMRVSELKPRSTQPCSQISSWGSSNPKFRHDSRYLLFQKQLCELFLLELELSDIVSGRATGGAGGAFAPLDFKKCHIKMQ